MNRTIVGSAVAFIYVTIFLLSVIYTDYWQGATESDLRLLLVAPPFVALVLTAGQASSPKSSSITMYGLASFAALYLLGKMHVSYMVASNSAENALILGVVMAAQYAATLMMIRHANAYRAKRKEGRE
ncbi:MAG: hypothetical protein Q4E01_07240 [Actinomycetaceae bacterium]|nr:hypothetical protein [Actinomycetaceae bacterium]